MFKKKLIRVEFIDTASGKVIGYDEQPARKLPETFEHATSVEIGQETYRVVKATPDTRKKFRKKAELTVELEKNKPDKATLSAKTGTTGLIAEVVSYGTRPSIDKVYKAASRADLFPAFAGKIDGKDLMAMGSWEWRQLELVAREQEGLVTHELSQIQDIKTNHSRLEGGSRVYTKQYRRSEIFNPLKGIRITSKELSEEHFPFSIPYDGFTFMAAKGYADGGFALKTLEGLELYGLEFGEKVTILSLRWPDSYPDQEKNSVTQLPSFMEAKGLILVDWDQYIVVRPEGLKPYLLSKAKHESPEKRQEESKDETGAGSGLLFPDQDPGE